MSGQRHIMDRRRFLTALGLGAGSLYLPSLRPRSAAAQSVPPRLIFFITPHGTVPGRWNMRQPGRDREEYDYGLRDLGREQFSDILRPLHHHREKLLIVDGLARGVTYAEEYRVARGGAPGDINRHHIAQAHLLTSQWAHQGAATARGGAHSIDQEIGNAVGEPGRWNSRVYGFNHQHAYSYVGANQPAPREQNPTNAFNDILGLTPQQVDESDGPISRSDRIRQARSSALDMANQEFDSVLPKLNGSDRNKLERHRALIRDLEIGLNRPPAMEGCDPTFFSEGHAIDQFSRLATVALACDLTRVVTLVTQDIPAPEFGFDASVNVHQDIAHASDEQRGTPDGIRGMMSYNRNYAAHFANLLDQLDSVQEGSETLLDHTTVVWLSELATGGHDLHRTPVVIAGGGSGHFRTGRYVHYAQTQAVDAAWENLEIGYAQERLFVNLMHSMGLTDRDHFGLPEVQVGSTTIPLSGPLPRLS